MLLDEVGNVIARGGSGVVIASQSGHRLPALTVEQNKALATTPVEEQRHPVSALKTIARDRIQGAGHPVSSHLPCISGQLSSMAAAPVFPSATISCR